MYQGVCHIIRVILFACLISSKLVWFTHVMAALSCSAAIPDPAPAADTPAAAVDLWAMNAAIPGSCIAAGRPMPSIPPVDTTPHHKMDDK